MARWRDIRYIAAFEMRREWVGMLLTGLFAIYIAAMMATMLPEILQASEDVPFLVRMMPDWLYLLVFPLYGCLMNWTIFHQWRDNLITRRLAHWRTMPIPVEAIVWARQMQAIVMTAIIGLVFLALQYALASVLRDAVTAAHWLAAGVVWASYGLVGNLLISWMELGSSGKGYAIWSLAYSLAVTAVSLVLAWADVSLFRTTLRLATEQPVLAPAAAIGIAAVATALSSRSLIRHMKRRAYAL